MFTLRILAVASALIGVGFGACGQARAQSCPADLSALSGQISTPAFQPALTMPVDQMITNAGGLDQAIAEAQQALSELSAVKARNIAENMDPGAPLNDAILILTSELSAFQCRRQTP